MAVAMTALAVAIGGTAAAEPIAHVAKAISGKKIKKRSIPGNRIKADSLGGTEIAEAKLAKVPAAPTADSAANAAHATSADSPRDAAKLGGLAPGAFVQGGGSHVQIRKTIPQNTAETKLFSIQDAGTISFGCVPSFTKVRFKNDTGQLQDVTITFITPNAPHADVDFSGPYAAGGESAFTLGVLHWMIHAGSGNGQATLDLTSSFANGECVIDVQGLSTLALT